MQKTTALVLMLFFFFGPCLAHLHNSDTRKIRFVVLPRKPTGSSNKLATTCDSQCQTQPKEPCRGWLLCFLFKVPARHCKAYQAPGRWQTHDVGMVLPWCKFLWKSLLRKPLAITFCPRIWLVSASAWVPPGLNTWSKVPSEDHHWEHPKSTFDLRTSLTHQIKHISQKTLLFDKTFLWNVWSHCWAITNDHTTLSLEVMMLWCTQGRPATFQVRCFKAKTASPHLSKLNSPSPN